MSRFFILLFDFLFDFFCYWFEAYKYVCLEEDWLNRNCLVMIAYLFINSFSCYFVWYLVFFVLIFKHSVLGFLITLTTILLFFINM